MRLALALGKTREELLTGERRPLSQREFIDWMRYDAVEPFGDERADLRFALLTSNVAAMLGNKTRWQQFMPFMEKREQSAEALWAIFDAFGRTIDGQAEKGSVIKRPLDGAR